MPSGNGNAVQTVCGGFAGAVVGGTVLQSFFGAQFGMAFGALLGAGVGYVAKEVIDSLETAKENSDAKQRQQAEAQRIAKEQERVSNPEEGYRLLNEATRDLQAGRPQRPSS